MGQRVKILIVDDDRDLADSIVELLRLHGYRAQAAYGGNDGIRRVQEGNFDVALVDVRMPDITGMECAAEISRLNARTQVLMMTAFRDESVLRAVEQGDIPRILNKPLDTSLLFDFLDDIEPAGLVLIADDDIDLCASLETFLSGLGYKVCIARTGHEAIGVALAEAVDIMLLDLKLPDITGAEVCSRLREHGRDVPVILVTGYADEEAGTIAELQAACGAVCFTKPIDPNALSEAVERALQDEG